MVPLAPPSRHRGESPIHGEPFRVNHEVSLSKGEGENLAAGLALIQSEAVRKCSSNEAKEGVK